MSEAVEAVLFDVDDTICEYERSPAEILELAFDHVGVEPFFDRDQYVARFDDFLAVSEDMRDLRRRCFASLAADSGRDRDLGHRIAAAYTDERDHSRVRFLDGAREALSHLAGDHRLAAVTNGAPAMQAQKLTSLGVADAFETVVHAGYDTPAKPAAEPFHEALDHLDVAPDRSVHVGNSLSSDVAGAHAAGLRSVWLADGETDPDPEPHYRIRSLRELRDRPWADD